MLLVNQLFRYQKRVSNIIDDVLEWSPTLALSGMMEKQNIVNVTEADGNSTGQDDKMAAEHQEAEAEAAESSDEEADQHTHRD